MLDEVVVLAVDALVRGDGGVHGVGAKQVESEFALGYDFIPQVHGEGAVGGAENRDVVILPFPDCSLHLIGTVVMRRDVLDGNSRSRRSTSRLVSLSMRWMVICMPRSANQLRVRVTALTYAAAVLDGMTSAWM